MPLIITPSALESFCLCGKVHYFRYIKGIKRPPGISLLAGTGFHRGAEMNFKQKMTTHTDLPLADVEEISINALRERVDQEGLSLAGEDKSKATVINNAEGGLRKISEHFINDVARSIQPLLVEPELPLIPLPNHDEVYLGGHPDLFTVNGILPDWKSSLTKFKSQQQSDTSIQLTGYHLGMTKAKTVYPELPDVRLIGLWSITPKGQRWLVTTRSKAHWDDYINRASWMATCIEKNIYHKAIPGHWKCQPKYCGFFGEDCR
jgi:hypothetical protein